MSTCAQIAANIANAQASTGPTTPEGLHRSSQNSLKHGLTAQTVLIPGEDPAVYQQFKQELTEFWVPEGAAEVAFVEELISIQWRLRRCERLEAAILSAEIPDFKALNNISLHGARLKRQYSATYKEMSELQHMRFDTMIEKRKQAELIRRADIINNRPSDFSEFGFDFTVEFIDQRISRQNRFEAATHTVNQASFRRAA